MQNPQSDPEDSNLELLRGTVKRVTFRNPENGYSVLQVSIDQTPEPVTVVGISATVKVGSHIVVKGSYREHPRFGKQLNAMIITEVAPSTAEGIEKYLGSGLIKGIGKKTAERLVSAFGEKTLEIIHQNPNEVARVTGIGKRKAIIIHEAFKEHEETKEVIRFLVEHGISPNLAHKIQDLYKDKTIETISRDPYLLARQLRGVGFLTADSIAMNLGFKPDSPERLKAGIYYALEKASDDGHCFLSHSDLSKKSRLLLGLSDEYDLSPYLITLVKEGFIVKDDDRLYLKHLFTAEIFVSKFITDRITPADSSEIDNHTISRVLSQASDELGITFSYEQEQAVRESANHKLIVITGGPGCGKTTIIRALSMLFQEASKRLLLAAPTGRAAQRMSQVCTYPSSTIHRLLKFDPRSGRFMHGINDPLPADAIIVDEASMIDIMLAKDLFSAIPRECTLILVGDKDQLPSVGPGRVFGDLIASRHVKTIALSHLFRRSEESHINTVAHMINSGVPPVIPEPDGITKSDTYFISKSDASEAAQIIESLVGGQITKKFGIPLSDITVLTPSNRGPLGTIELNKKLQAKINPPGSIDSEQEIQIGDLSLRIGDRVCQRSNNYQIDPFGVFNGDTGEIHSIDRSKNQLTVELWDGRLIKYEQADINQLSLAYAVTVHRSQGSEIPCVVLALSESHYTLLERQLIYTAVTRAKKLLIVVGSKRALAIACKRTSTQKRCTLLKERIMKNLSD